MPEKVKARFIDPMLLLKTEKLGTQLGEQERCAAIQPMDWSMCSARVVQSGAAAALAASQKPVTLARAKNMPINFTRMPASLTSGER